MMNYTGVINNSNQYEVYDENDIEVLTLNHVTRFTKNNSTQSKEFEDENELMEFITQQTRLANQSNFKQFQPRGYEVEGDVMQVIKFYYEIIVSNA